MKPNKEKTRKELNAPGLALVQQSLQWHQKGTAALPAFGSEDLTNEHVALIIY